MAEFHCRVAEANDDRRRIFALRYSIYIEEMGRSARYVDHVRKEIQEPYDSAAVLYGAFEDSQCVATMRLNFLNEPGMSDYRTLYRVPPTTPNFAQCVATTKVMLARHLRRSLGAIPFFEFVATDILARGGRYNFCDANDNVLGFFYRLGHKKWVQDKVAHPDYGDVTILRMDLGDIEFLEQVRSPLLSVARHHFGNLQDRGQLSK